jgi:hypothetical protein
MPELFSLDSEVRPKDDVIVRELQGESVLLDLNRGLYFGLDTVGTRIWQLVQQHHRLRDVLAAMLSEYEVDESTCTRDLLSLVETLREKQLVEVVNLA